jgi:hypothetical protein
MGFTNAVSSGLRVNASYVDEPSSMEQTLERTRLYWKNPLPTVEIMDDSVLDNVEAKIANVIRQKQARFA